MKLKMKNLKKIVTHDKKPVILDIEELEIKPGWICGITGPNGAGKTTLLRIIAGLDEDYEGFLYYGEGESENPPFAKMTMVFQKPYLISTTVEKNIMYPMKIRKYPEKELEEKTQALIKEIGLEAQQKQKVHSLSGGEIQKVALARALSFQPALVLLDEPTANIDKGTKEIIEAMLLRINQENKTTILLITHDQTFMEKVCDQVIYMEDGKVMTIEKTLKSINPDEGKGM